MAAQGPICPSPQGVVKMEKQVHHLLEYVAKNRTKWWLQVEHKRGGKIEPIQAKNLIQYLIFLSSNFKTLKLTYSLSKKMKQPPIIPTRVLSVLILFRPNQPQDKLLSSMDSSILECSSRGVKQRELKVLAAKVRFCHNL